MDTCPRSKASGEIDRGSRGRLAEQPQIVLRGLQHGAVVALARQFQDQGTARPGRAGIDRREEHRQGREAGACFQVGPAS